MLPVLWRTVPLGVPVKCCPGEISRFECCSRMCGAKSFGAGEGFRGRQSCSGYIVAPIWYIIRSCSEPHSWFFHLWYYTKHL